ncbi:glycohydrolase toxin TNT-related protein [Nonomuraea sp. FMUSA5-5]|uniref:Glycohydrolase toxin TNT-related protein n=1 Tax=Nonomuraea composti TaxID=2720023 RepID=A0ABX1B402_9ACTN|nr:glycohydrolase toxin TNT-related protein [Nonomuraea sp. FMUSA5-5]NJP90424.1 glycohydrolase toxin TNT-related protein [Nonomuraea sp. FMUSA5-5]
MTGDPTPGNPEEVRTLAEKLLGQAKLAEDNTARLNGVASNGSALRMRGDYAPKYTEALSGLPAELAKLGAAYRGASNALKTYADSLGQAKMQAGTALSQGRSADMQYQGALREIRALLPAASGLTSLAEVESAVKAADPGLQASVRPAVQRAQNAEADRGRARRIADEAARLRGQAANRAAEGIQQALEGSGIQNKSWLEQAWDTVSTPFRSWDDFVNLARNVAMVAGLALLVVGTGGIAGAVLLGAAVVAGAVVFADSLNKFRQGKVGLGQVVMDGIGVLPGGRQVGLLAQGAKAVAGLRGMAAGVRAGGGQLLGLGALRAGLPAGATALRGALPAGLRAAGTSTIRSAMRAGAGRVSTAASTAWQKTKQFFSKDPVHFPSGTVLLPQTDVELPGVLPLLLERTYLSSYRQGRWFGPSWASTLDQRLEIDAEGVCLATASGALLTFSHPDGERPVLPSNGPPWLLCRKADHYLVTDPAASHTLHFAVSPDPPIEEAGEPHVLPLGAITDRNGNRIDLRYTSEGVPVEVVHSGGYHLGLETHAGLVVAIRLREAAQTLITYGYDEHANLTEITNSSGLPLRFSYDADGRMTGWRDRIGTWYAYTYDGQGRCTAGTGIDGVFDTEISYADRVTTARDSLGHVTTYRYNDLLQVTQETDPLGHTTTYEWDRHDRLLAHTDPLGRTTTYHHDDLHLQAITRPDGARRTFNRDEHGMPTVVTDFDATTWPLTRDERGNLIADSLHRYTYTEHGHLASVTNALGHTHTVETNEAGLPTAVTDPLGATTRYDRDPFGRIASVTDPLGQTTSYTWTVEGRLASRNLPSGATEQWAYDAENNLIEHRDPLGQVTRTDIDPFDLPAAQTTPDGARLTFTHDTELHLVQVTNPQGLTWSYTYDPNGALIGETDFNHRVLTYIRDPAGRITERVNGAGQPTRYAYDDLDRPIERQSGDQVTTFTYDPLGRLTRAANADADLQLVRDQHGRVIAETCNGLTLTSTYDAMGRRTHHRTPSGAESTWEYDAGDRLVALHTSGHIIQFGYDPAGRETSRRFGTGMSLTHHWDPDSRVRAQTLGPASEGSRAIQRRSHSYRPDGYLVQVDDLLSGRRRYDLDPAGRVTAVHGSGWSEHYAYDSTGQITDAAWPGPRDAQGSRAYAGTLLQQAGHLHYEYDSQGRTVARRRERPGGRTETWRYTWSADDRLTGVTAPDGQEWRYLYDPLGRRITKERADGTGRVHFVWDGLNLAEQISEDRTTVWNWAPGTFRPLTQTERIPAQHAPQEWIDAQFSLVITDLIGTPLELAAPEGHLTWRLNQAHWGTSPGAITAGADCPLRFPGQYADQESGLHYNYFRHYDPQTARFLSNDPLGLAGGWLPHAYVLNTTGWLDPLGLAAYPRDNNYRWPRNNGFDGPPVDLRLNSGDRFDRYGYDPALDGGRFVSPAGTAFETRALDRSARSRRLTTYEVTRPIDVQYGLVRPWFGQPGGGFQILLPNGIDSLLKNGDIRVVS